jgi:quercetin dioxygenase-like cupin family protein
MGHTGTGRETGCTRRSVLGSAIVAMLFPFVPAWAAMRGGDMEIKRSGSQPSANSASVTFEPGARTAWHTHPLGQTLIVTSGAGRAQRWGGPVEEIRPGDVVWIPPDEKHWHGASPTTAMTHIAIQEKLDGKPVDWLEHVSAEQYEGRANAR